MPSFIRVAAIALAILAAALAGLLGHAWLGSLDHLAQGSLAPPAGEVARLGRAGGVVVGAGVAALVAAVLSWRRRERIATAVLLVALAACLAFTPGWIQSRLEQALLLGAAVCSFLAGHRGSK